LSFRRVRVRATEKEPWYQVTVAVEVGAEFPEECHRRRDSIAALQVQPANDRPYLRWPIIDRAAPR
jgi:hypothetical protein